MIGALGIPREILRVAFLVVLVSLTSFVLGRCSADPESVFVTVTDSSKVVAGETPAEPLPLPQRVTTTTEQPVARAIAAGAARVDVATFCAAAGWTQPGASPPAPLEDVSAAAIADTPGVPPASAPPASTSPLPVRPSVVALIRSGEVDRTSAVLRLVESDGDLRADRFRVRPPFQFRVDGDSLIVRGSRFGILRDLVPIALCAGGGWVSHRLDRWEPLAAGCALGVWDVIR